MKTRPITTFFALLMLLFGSLTLKRRRERAARNLLTG